jgi:hypothetical protein
MPAVATRSAPVPPSRKPRLATPAPRSPSGGGGAGAGRGPAVKLSGAIAGKDPRFQEALDRLQGSAATSKRHPSAASKVSEAQAAADPKGSDQKAGAQELQVGAMQDSKDSKPESSSFLTVLRKAIQDAMPKKVEEGKDFMKGNDKVKLQGALSGNIEQQQAQATAGLEAAKDQPPNPGAVPAKEVVPLGAIPGAAQPPAVNAGDAMPQPAPEADVSLQANKQEGDRLYTDNKLTTSQLEEANDPRFSKVVAQKTNVDAKAVELPQQYRGQEQAIRGDAVAKVTGDEQKGLAQFQGQQGKSNKDVRGKQMSGKEQDEARRKKVADDIEKIYTKTKENVEKKLESLDKEATDLFDQGTEAALKKMRDYVEERFDDRYSGVIGKGKWLKDKLLPLPDFVKAWFDQAYKVFNDEMDALVVRVANLVERRLKEAKDEVGKGQKEIRNYVNKLPEDLKAVGQAAEKEVSGRFDDLRRSIDDKKNDLVQKMAQKYKEAMDKGQKALKELKDAHKSLLEKLRDAVMEVVEILRNFKNRVLALLKKAAQAIDIIVSSPIRFLKNLLNAIKQGLYQFVDRIWDHLKAGFMEWILGPLGEMGVTIPKEFSLPSILMMVLQILGLTYDRLRTKAVKLIGERNVAMIEKVFQLLKALWDGGPAKLWEQLKEFLSDLKEQIVDAIQNWLITTIIKSAITKLATMFNPVGAIIQAILTIYNVVMFLIEQINKIMQFVEAVVNSVYDIATGAIGTAANWIEKALAKTVPILIGFLARLLGISGIAQKITSIVKSIQKRVDDAVDKVIGKIIGGIKGLVGSGKALAQKGLEKVKAMIFPKKTISVSGETHTLQIAEAAGKNRIVIQSRKFNLDEFVAEAKTKESNDPNPKFKAAIGKLEKEGAPWEALAEDTEQQKTKKSKAYLDVYEKVQEVFRYMPNDEAVPASSISWTIGPRGRAKEVVANPLTINGEGGSAPQDDVPGWTGTSGVPEARIRAHLLHHALHGPGRRFNLTPTSTSTNGLIYHRFEKHAIDAVTKKKKTLFYKTIVTYDDSQKGPYKDVAKTVTMKVYDLKTKKPIEGAGSDGDTFSNF